MKKLFIALMFSLVTTVSFSQISELAKPLKQTKVSVFGAVLISCDRYENFSLFHFDDSKYQQLKVPVTFTLTDSEFEEVHTALTNKFSKKEFTDDEGFIMTTKDNVQIIFKFAKMMGIKSVNFGIEKNGIMSLGYTLTQKQVNKLFDKSSS